MENPLSPSRTFSSSPKKPLQQSNSFSNSASLSNTSKASAASMEDDTSTTHNKERRMTIGLLDLADLLKQATSPAPPSLPAARRMTVDSAEITGLIESIEAGTASTDSSFQAPSSDAPGSPQAPVPGNTRRTTLDPADMLAIIRQASTPVAEDDETVPPERRQVIDVQELQNVFDVLSMKSPSVAVAGSSIAVMGTASAPNSNKKSKGMGVAPSPSVDHDAVDSHGNEADESGSNDEGGDSGDSDDDGDGEVGSSRPVRQTVDPSALAALVQRVSSPADDSVPDDCRLSVDADAIQKIRDLMAESPFVSANAAAAVEDDDDDDAEDTSSEGRPASSRKKTPGGARGSNKRRTTVDVGDLYDLLRVAISPATTASSATDEDVLVGGGGNQEGDAVGGRRQTIDPSSFADILANISAKKKSEGILADGGPEQEEDEEKEAAPVHAATPDAQRKRRTTVDGAWFNEMLKAVSTPGASTTNTLLGNGSGGNGEGAVAKSPVPATAASASVSAATPSDAPGNAARRMTVDANEMLNLLVELGAQSPNPASPYVSPPVSARTRRGRKSPAAASSSATKPSSTTSSSSAKKKRPKSPAAATAAASAKKGTPTTSSSSSKKAAKSGLSPRAAKKSKPASSPPSSPPVAANEGPRRDSLQGMAAPSSPLPRNQGGDVGFKGGGLDEQQAPSSALKSCLSSRKAPRTGNNGYPPAASTPGGGAGGGRSVVFGAAAAAEFRRTDPSSTLTPMPRDQVRAQFPSMSASSEEPSEELREEEEVSPGGTVTTRLVAIAGPNVSATKVNSRILAAWGDGNSEVAASGGGLEARGSPARRASGKFTLPAPSSLTGGSGGSSDMEDDAFESASSTKGSMFQSRIDSVADHHDFDDDHEEEVQLPKLLRVGAGEDQTVELEDNLGTLGSMLQEPSDPPLSRRRRSSAAAGAGGGRELDEEYTMELEPGLSDLLTVAGSQANKKKQQRQRTPRAASQASTAAAAVQLASSSAAFPRDDDQTCELEVNLGDLTSLRSNSSDSSASSSKKKKSSGNSGRAFARFSVGFDDDEPYTARSQNEDNTVELEGALADLVAGNNSFGGSSSLLAASPAPRRNLTPFRPPAARSTLSSRSHHTTDHDQSLRSSKRSSSRGGGGSFGEASYAEDSEANTSALSSASGLSTRSVAASEAFGLLLDQNAEAALLQGDGGRNLLDTSGTSSFQRDRDEASIAGEEGDEEEQEEEQEEEPVYVSEFKELLEGLGLREKGNEGDDNKASLADTLRALSAEAGSDDGDQEGGGGGSGGLFPYAAKVEGEVVRETCENFMGELEESVIANMTETLWTHARQFKEQAPHGSSPHAVEVLLRALRKQSSNRESLTDEEAALVEQAKASVKEIRAVALREWADSELSLLEALEARLAEAADLVAEEGQSVRDGRAELERLASVVDSEAQLGNAARRLLQAEEASAAQDEVTARAAAQNVELEALVREEEEACAKAQGRAVALVAVRDEVHALSDLRSAKEELAVQAAGALEGYQVAAALRSWVPRSLGGACGGAGSGSQVEESIVVDFPLAADVATGTPTSLTLTLRLTPCPTSGGSGSDRVTGVSWALTTGTAAGKTSKRPKSMLLVGGSSSGLLDSESVLSALQTRLVNEWVGREVGRLSAPPSASSPGPLLADVPRTLNRFDALIGRLRLVLLEVKAIEDGLGLVVKLRDASEGSTVEPSARDEEEEAGEAVWGGSDAAGLWLQVEMASMKHHCKVRMEVRVVDGYPWAPAQVRMVPLLGKCPKKLKQQVKQVFGNGRLPNGAPVLAGAGAIESAVRTAYTILA